MYTSVVLVALSGYFANAAVPERPEWLSNYSLAYKQGQKERKPLAVVFGTGAEGWQKVSKDGKLGKEAQRLLDTRYVCVYVDLSTEEGRRLAESMEITDSAGIVLSDRTGAHQAFWHDGSLSEAELERQLRRHADPNRVVQTTETLQAEERRSYYPPTHPAPVYTQPNFGGFGGGRGGC